MKKEYIKPQTEVMTIQQQGMLCGSGAQSLSNSAEGFSWDTDGFEDSEGDN